MIGSAFPLNQFTYELMKVILANTMSGEGKDQEVEQLAKWVRSAQNGEQKAFGEIIRVTQRRLIKFAYLLTGQSEIAEDLCQETYLKAFEAISSLKEPERAVPWLYRILKNLSIDRVRSAAHQNEQGTEDLEVLMDPTTSTGSERHQILEIRELMATLEASDRFLVLAVHLEGYSYKEAAEIAGLTEDAVRLRLHRARKFLLEKLSDPETKSAVRPSKV